MTFEEFDKFQEELFAECKKMRDTKGKEYAHAEDRFANFNRTAERKGVDRLLVAGILLDKHLDAIDSFIKTGKVESAEGIRGRGVDAIVYISLILGMIKEKEESKGIPKFKIGDLVVTNKSLDANVGKVKYVIMDIRYDKGSKEYVYLVSAHGESSKREYRFTSKESNLSLPLNIPSKRHSY